MTTLNDLQDILDALEQAPTVQMGDAKWRTVQLGKLTLGGNSPKAHPTRLWVCVRVEELIINGKTYVLSRQCLDAHITLGYCSSNSGPLSTRNAEKILAEKGTIWMELMQDSEHSGATRLFFEFMVHSAGGPTLQQLRQTLLDKPLDARGMSPPGAVFHLSMYWLNDDVV
jgi:hypothetical protein